MNDLEYRRKQLLKLQDAVIDLEDLSSGVSIADLTLTDFRIDLAQYLREHQPLLESLPLGTFAVTTASPSGETAIPPGIIFCVRHETPRENRSVGFSPREASEFAPPKPIEPGYPLAPHYLVHIGEDGATLLPFTQAKQLLDGCNPKLRSFCGGALLAVLASHTELLSVVYDALLSFPSTLFARRHSWEASA